MNENPKMSYEALLAELNQVLSKIERDETGIDELTDAVRFAYEKINVLRQRLTETETQLKEVIALGSMNDTKSDAAFETENIDEV